MQDRKYLFRWLQYYSLKRETKNNLLVPGILDQTYSFKSYLGKMMSVRSILSLLIIAQLTLSGHTINDRPFRKTDRYIFVQKEKRRNPNVAWTLVWEDNFNKGKLDTSTWSRIDLFTSPKWKTPKERWQENTGCFRYITGTNEDVVRFDKDHIYLRGIVNHDTIHGDPRPYLTGGIYSAGKFSFQYGRIEIRAKLDAAHGAWPAIWMMSEKDVYPDQHNGEMDIMERLNHDAFAYQTTHNHYTITIKQETPKKFNTGKIDTSGFNVYSVSWYPDKLVYAINGVETITYPKVPGAGTYQWPFDQPFYLIIDQQLEGSWPGKIKDPKELPINMVVDWVRLYQ